MTTTHADDLVDGYLRRLQGALAGVPAERRDEIVEEIAQHIADERAQMPDASEADVLNLLDRMGEPSEVAAAAADGTASKQAPPARRIGAVEVLALVLTPFLWPVGVILLWLSPAWSTRDKLIGTLLPPGGYSYVLWLPGVLLFNAVSICSSGGDQYGNVQQSCTGVAAVPEWQQVAFGIALILGVILLLMLPLLTAIYMGWRLRQWSSSAAA